MRTVDMRVNRILSHLPLKEVLFQICYDGADESLSTVTLNL